jgi:hypothetical protein
MGPQLDCVLRRCRLPPVDLEKEALKQPKLTKKKVRGSLAESWWAALDSGCILADAAWPAVLFEATIGTLCLQCCLLCGDCKAAAVQGQWLYVKDDIPTQ